jgi:hypothetical protein
MVTVAELETIANHVADSLPVEARNWSDARITSRAKKAVREAGLNPQLFSYAVTRSIRSTLEQKWRCARANRAHEEKGTPDPTLPPVKDSVPRLA